MILRFSLPARAIAAAAVCMSILGGLVVSHAWPLWTGQTIVLPVTASDQRDVFRGERLHLNTPANAIVVSDDSSTPETHAVVVRPADSWPRNLPTDRRELRTRLRGAVVYVQFERRQAATGEEFHPVSIGMKPADGLLNLRGRVFPMADFLRIDYGLDAFYVQEGTARAARDAVQQGKTMHMQVAVAASGRARVRNILIDGQPLVQ